MQDQCRRDLAERRGHRVRPASLPELVNLVADPDPHRETARRRLGADDERDLFPQALRLVEEAQPRAVLLENVRGLATSRFAGYRADILLRLHALGYATQWQVINACEHGVSQLRPRFVLLGVKEKYASSLTWPQPQGTPPTVGEAIGDLMAANGWPGAPAWRARARGIGPTLVGGSRKHGGPDLGPTRARADRAALGVNGKTLAEAPPQLEDPVDHMPRLTLRMAARIQGFPDDWQFSGRKTAAYRQIGNAFPPPVARALGTALATALGSTVKTTIPGQRLRRLAAV